MIKANGELQRLNGIRSLIIIAQFNQLSLGAARIDHSFDLEGRDATRDELLLICNKGNLMMKAPA